MELPVSAALAVITAKAAPQLVLVITIPMSSSNRVDKVIFADSGRYRYPRLDKTYTSSSVQESGIGENEIPLCPITIYMCASLSAIIGVKQDLMTIISAIIQLLVILILQHSFVSSIGTILRPCLSRCRCGCLSIPAKIMAALTGAQSAIASDVVCVLGPNGLYSTDFYVKFSLPSFNPSSLDGLYLDPDDDIETNGKGDKSKLMDRIDRGIDDSPSGKIANGHECKKNNEDERLQLLKVGPEWVDIYCNDQHCSEIQSVVGINEQLFFVEDKKLSLVPSGLLIFYHSIV
jgi:hypothetical protein